MSRRKVSRAKMDVSSTNKDSSQGQDLSDAEPINPPPSNAGSRTPPDSSATKQVASPQHEPPSPTTPLDGRASSIAHSNRQSSPIDDHNPSQRKGGGGLWRAYQNQPSPEPQDLGLEGWDDPIPPRSGGEEEDGASPEELVRGFEAATTDDEQAFRDEEEEQRDLGATQGETQLRAHFEQTVSLLLSFSCLCSSFRRFLSFIRGRSSDPQRVHDRANVVCIRFLSYSLRLLTGYMAL